jgi:SAM-dependent methyltransferase
VGFLITRYKEKMHKKTLYDLQIPESMKGNRCFFSDDSVIKWEDELISFFTSNYKIFTPYSDYFKLRCFEFRVLRQLLPSYFTLRNKYETILEIGCGFGFKSVLLLPFCDRVLGVDIPEKYKGYIVGNFETSIEIAKILVNEKLNISNANFECSWPDNLKIESDTIPLIFSEYVLEHIPDLSLAINEMYRVLRKNGIMIHVVPNTKDAIIQFINANINFSLKKIFSMAKVNMAQFLGRSHGSFQIKLNGTIVPPCHSEFIDDYSRQIEIYTLENYLFPMLDAGFKIEKIISTREHNNVIVARK